MQRHSVTVKSFDELSTRELYAILKLRTDVFFVEQRIDETELDGRDLHGETEHYWIADAVQRGSDLAVVAYLRVLHSQTPEHRDAGLIIGRVVVDPEHRGQGLARILMDEVLARHGGEAIVLHAQEYVAGLYARFGFETFGEPYHEAGIAHIGMYRPADVAA
jgi:ElaA protein